MSPFAPPPRPPRRRAGRAAVVGVAAAAMFVAGGLGLGLRGGPEPVATPGSDPFLAAPEAATRLVAARGNTADPQVDRLQRRVADQPQDAAGWAALAAAYVQQARVTVDPAYYPKAEGALRRSLELHPTGNLAAFLGMGSLANARHDFAGAVVWGRKALAVSDYNPAAYAVLADAYTQLGEPGRATSAVQRMLDLSPSLPALTRASYDLEQRGRLGLARDLLEQALAQAYTPADVGFCRYYLGELAFGSGDLVEAARQYDHGLTADPGSAPLLQGRAKVAALRGNSTAALRDYADLVGRVPNPQYLVEYGELLASLGRATEAKQQFALVETVHRLFTSNGGQDDLALAEFEADHGSPARAVRFAEAEWDRRRSAVVADALAWALHAAGRDADALRYADRAVARGWRNALFFHHRAEIHRALGDRSAAAADAARVKLYNPHFDPELPAFGRPT